MAVDDPESETKPRPRIAVGKSSAPSVESSLDQFIARANEQLVDVSAFEPENRELALHREIETLKHKLLEIETRTTTPDRGRHRWSGMVAAFVVGGALVFGVTSLLPKHDSAPPPAATASPAPSREASAVTVTPIAEPKPASPPVAAPEPTPPPAEPAPVAESKPAAKPAKPAARVTHSRPAPPPTPDKPPPPAPDKKPGDPGLFNPF